MLKLHVCGYYLAWFMDYLFLFIHTTVLIGVAQYNYKKRGKKVKTEEYSYVHLINIIKLIVNMCKHFL